MKLHRRDIEFRARQRGYAWSEVEPCLVKDLGDGWYEVDVNHEAYPRTQKPGTVRAKNMGLGDIAKKWLSAIGITEQRVSKVLGRPCGCSKRAEALNELGRRIGIG
jgi:hypothetical protein